jgi:hypothetical protein
LANVTRKWRPLCPEKLAACSRVRERGGRHSRVRKWRMASVLEAGPGRKAASADEMSPPRGALSLGKM